MASGMDGDREAKLEDRLEGGEDEAERGEVKRGKSTGDRMEGGRIEKQVLFFIQLVGCL